MLDTVSSQYNSCVFWKLPIPELDLSELEGLGLAVRRPSLKPGTGEKRSRGKEYDLLRESAENNSLAEYNSFNYWRAPIASLDFSDFL